RRAGSDVNSMIATLKPGAITRQFLSSFGLADHQMAQNARLLLVILLSLMLAITVTECVNLVVLPVHAFRWLSIIAAVDGLGLALLGVNQHGHARQASIMLVLALTVIVTVCAATAGGIHTPAA